MEKLRDYIEDNSQNFTDEQYKNLIELFGGARESVRELVEKAASGGNPMASRLYIVDYMEAQLRYDEAEEQHTVQYRKKQGIYLYNQRYENIEDASEIEAGEPMSLDICEHDGQPCPPAFIISMTWTWLQATSESTDLSPIPKYFFLKAKKLIE